MNIFLRVAARLTRAWVRLYTTRMPADLRETRRCEVDADLWDHESDARESGTPGAIVALEILLRTCVGIADDVSWRFEALKAAASDSPERSSPLLELLARQTRWMGFCGVIGGVLWAGDIIYFTQHSPTSALRGYDGVAFTLLLMFGLVGFWAEQRGRLHKSGAAGIVLVFSSLFSLFLMNVLWLTVRLRGDSALAQLLGVAFALLLAPGFLLLGIALKGTARAVSLVIACAFLVWFMVPRALSQMLPGVRTWYRGDSPLGMAFFVLAAIGLALAGYSVFRTSVPRASLNK